MQTYPKNTEVQPRADTGIENDTSGQTHRDQEPSSAFKSPQQVAEETLGKIEWVDEVEGFLDCPGKARHTTRDAFRDCRIRLDGVPTVFCLHDHCREEINDANKELRSAMNANLVRWPSHAGEYAPPSRRPVTEMDELAKRAARALPDILCTHAWDLNDLQQNSPIKLKDAVGLEWMMYLTLYQLDDVVWIGGKYDSGSAEYEHCFKKVSEWIEAGLSEDRGPFICASTFKPGTVARKKENVAVRRFLVVELDRIDEIVEAKGAKKEPLTDDDKFRNKTKSAAVFHWLKDEVGLRLRAVVDSGNKSLHAHFEMPPDDVLAELEIVLPAMKCDAATLRPAQPVRRPCYIATDGSGRQQTLLYLDRSKKVHPPCRLPSEVLPLLDDETFSARPPHDSASTTEGDPALCAAEASSVDGGPETHSSSSSGWPGLLSACGHTESTIGSGPDLKGDFIAFAEILSGSSNSSNSSSPASSGKETQNASSTTSSNSSPQAPPPPVAASTTSSNSSPPPMGWPNALAPAAFHGIAGEIVHMIEPHTEADRAALLIQLLAALGNIVGRNVYITADGARHHLNLFIAIVGATSKGRKGTSWNQIARLVICVDEVWKNERNTTGLSSGEGLIANVRDATAKDTGVEDKRLFVVEGELANTLKVMAREGNTLSPILRQAWDGHDLNTLVKKDPAKSTAPHISLVGHITKDELLAQMRAVDTSNGFANRFLWIAATRSKCLPEGGAIDDVNFDAIVKRLFSIIDSAKFCGEVKRSKSARELWRKVYPVLSEGKPGMVGAITGRAEAQVMRLSAIYAMLDQSKLIEPEHHEAAMALWRYCEETARWIFGNKTGDKDADKILSALRKAGAKGLSRTDIWKNVFSNNKSSHDLDEALQTLVNYNFAENRKQGAVEQWFVKS